MIVPLQVSVPIVLNGSGNGIASAGPLSAREIWYPGNVHVAANANPTSQAFCQVFVGPDTTASNYRDSTGFGSTGASTGACNADVIRSGWRVWAVWTGGDPGVQAVLTITGTKSV